MADEPTLTEETSAPEPSAEPTSMAEESETTAVVAVEHVVARIEAWFQEHLTGKYPLAVEQEIATKVTQLKQELRGQ